MHQLNSHSPCIKLQVLLHIDYNCCIWAYLSSFGSNNRLTYLRLFDFCKLVLPSRNSNESGHLISVKLIIEFFLETLNCFFFWTKFYAVIIFSLNCFSTRFWSAWLPDTWKSSMMRDILNMLCFVKWTPISLNLGLKSVRNVRKSLRIFWHLDI